MKITLTSTSPRRIKLIRRLGYDIEVVAPVCDENIDCSDPRKLAETLAERKALSVRGEVVIGADTVVVTGGGEVLGKPNNAADAERMLKKLCGDRHRVITGVCVRSSARTLVDSQTTYVSFKEYDEKLLGQYIADGKSFDKAGAYGIQDDEMRTMVTDIDGDIDNVIGLPLALVERLIKSLETT